ncbi:GTP-binding protein 2 [Strongyloides ratti]|uniref:GTP-binding protein 2 n=1 Tax=Strongyloides ratti TaxID=34506 RepID=A0A090MTT4_STRRB|nr:GTP-binding protein 2 [Strongyloides ratti]CEF61743.1 GTP-binding protein 2 [Strongyloides ratti]
MCGLVGRLPPEEEYGNIEYKTRLTNISESRVKHLITQMKWRLEEGNGKAIYEIGVADDGVITGLNDFEMETSLQTMKIMAEELCVKMTIINEKKVEGGKKMVEIVVEKEEYEDNFQEIRVAIIGSAEAGKSTLCGVLSQGELDDGKGRARVNVFRYLHEFKTGRTSSICLTTLRYDNKGKMLGKCNPNHLIDSSCSKIVTLIDLAGDKKYLKTTIYGISGYRPNVCCVVISGKGPPGIMTKEHLGFVMALNIPFFVVITKIDSVNEDHLTKVMVSINSLLKTVSGDRKTVYVNNEDIVEEYAISLCNRKKIIPIISLSSVNGKNLNILKKFLGYLKNNNITRIKNVTMKKKEIDPLFYVEEVFKVTGVGIVVCGTLSQGMLTEGDRVRIGPTSRDGSFVTATIKSIHKKKQEPIKNIYGGETASLAINIEKHLHVSYIIKRLLIQKGMILVGIGKNNELKLCRQFIARFFLLSHHSRGIIFVGFQGTMYIGSVCQTVTIINIEGGEKSLKTGRWYNVKFEFYSIPQCIKVGDSIIFREGKTKGMGEILKIFCS